MDSPPPVDPTAAAKAIRPGLLLVFLTAMGLGGGLVFELIALAERVHRARCPADTFLVGGSGAVVVILPEMVMGLGLSLWAILWVVRLFPGAVAAYERYANSPVSGAYGRLQKGLGVFAVVATLVGVPLSTILIFNQFCLTPAAIIDQNAPWTGLRRLPWTEVASVETSCTHGKGWGSSFAMTLRSGHHINLSSQTTDGDWVVAYPRIARALHGGSFAFDASAVEAGCPQPELPMLTTRP